MIVEWSTARAAELWEEQRLWAIGNKMTDRYKSRQPASRAASWPSDSEAS
jgi:hypothetical protein